MSYAEDLSRELSNVGIGGRLRRRIATEITDHLACDPDADLGPPGELAHQFADQLGSARARRAGLGVFAGLAVAGSLLVAAALAFNRTGPGFARLHPPSRPLADMGLVLMVVGGQLAFVSGLLAAIRSFRRRREDALPRREAVLIGRRATVGLVAGLACMAGLALMAAEFHRSLPGWWEPLALGAAAAGATALLATVPLLLSAAAIRPLQDGVAGDLFDDLEGFVPPVLQGRDWLFALIVAGGVGGVIVLGGLAGDDPFDGLARGVADALACLAGFAFLGRYLGLRSRPAS